MSKVHFSSDLNEWRICVANKKPCKFGNHSNTQVLKQAKQWLTYKTNPNVHKSYQTIPLKLLKEFHKVSKQDDFVMPTSQDRKVSENVLNMHKLRTNLIIDENQKIKGPILEGNFLERAQSLIGKNLTSLYVSQGYKPGDKGWKGTAVESAFGLKHNSSPEPDTEDGEIKSYTLGKEGEFPKETIALASYNPNSNNPLSKSILEDLVNKVSFIDSHLYKKIQKTINVGIEVDALGNAIVAKVDFIDLSEDKYKKDLEIISNEWALLVEAHNSGKKVPGNNLKYLESRTKGGQDSKTRAFYWKRTGIIKLLSASRQN